MRSEELCIELILWLCGGSRLGSLLRGSQGRSRAVHSVTAL